ncbi:MAG: TonB-dependent receptor plug domain-containing protein [Deltaproteobacteria bacterium]
MGGTLPQLLSTLVILLALAAPALADPSPDASGEGEESLLVLGSQLEAQVVSSTKTAQRAAEAPAVMTVITGDEIRARGYASLADALRWVPGFYDVDDLVTHNVGVRGINGGVGASGSVVKLMIDGMPVDYRPTTGNFFGPELIPVEAIDRVEIVRGPASALYGANAFLGVVNVITRSGADLDGLTLAARGALVRQNPGGGGDLAMGGAAGNVDALVAASFLDLDRSGLSPSPMSVAQIPRLAAAGPSAGDVARPKSLLAKLSVQDVLGGTASLLASIQNLDSGAEFQEAFPLSHDSRVDLANQDYRLRWAIAPSDQLSFEASLVYFDGAPLPETQFDIGQPGAVLVPEVETRGYGVASEAHERPLAGLELVQGFDYTVEDNLLQSFSTLLTAPTAFEPAGALLPGSGAGATFTFKNFGAYAQAAYRWSDAWSATAGARIDDHTLYGVNPSGRAGLVYSPSGSPLSLKLLYGSSFKAPSAVQLFTQPMAPLTLTGNPGLAPQTAQTGELALGWKLPSGRGELIADAYLTDVFGQVEFLQQGLFLQARNVPDMAVAGGELDLRVRLADALNARILAGLAETVSQDLGPAFLGLPAVSNPLYPPYQLHVIVDWGLPWGGLTVSPELSLIGPRGSSQSNALIYGGAYELPPYLYTGGSLSTGPWHLFGARVTRFALHATDLTGQIWYEPGFNGIDVPSMGRTAMLTLTQGL